jgi:hypothetical protein
VQVYSNYEMGERIACSILEGTMISKICPMRISALLIVAVVAALHAHAPFAAVRSAKAPSAQAAAAPPTLDYEFFKTRVEPIFLKHRSDDHARCYTCHEDSIHGQGIFHLETLPPGMSFWTEEQSRRNFEVVSKLVIPGAPKSSMFLLKTLAPEAGGNFYRLHDGGRQFASQDDPDWKTLAAWVNGEKVGGSTK